MLKKQFILAGAGILLVAGLFFFGRTVTNKKPVSVIAAAPKDTINQFNIEGFIAELRTKLSPANAQILAKLENADKGDKGGQLNAKDVIQEKINLYNSLAAFWKDSAKAYEPYAFYISEASKLDNSEKSLTFAARLFSENLRGEADEAKLDWEATQAIDLYEKAIELNPGNDDLKIGLGSSYIYGRARSGDPMETMKGINVLRGVVEKDSTNMKAQLLLGAGGIVSGQYDKAVARLKKVVEAQPDNAEAVAYLADAYAGIGNKELAIKYYNISKRLINDPHYSEEADKRIKALK